jgi:hypothetical protein
MREILKGIDYKRINRTSEERIIAGLSSVKLITLLCLNIIT